MTSRPFTFGGFRNRSIVDSGSPVAAHPANRTANIVDTTGRHQTALGETKLPQMPCLMCPNGTERHEAPRLPANSKTLVAGIPRYEGWNPSPFAICRENVVRLQSVYISQRE